MCRPKKNNDTPLVKRHRLLSSVYTAEFFIGNKAALKTVKVFNQPIVHRGAIPKDVSSKVLDAFAPEKAKILLDEKEWKCICCNEDATQFCSSIVGAPSMETVICFTEKIYVVCNDDKCIAKVTQKKNEDSRKLVVSEFDFRFSFRSALRPIHVDDGIMMSSTLEMPAVKGAMKKNAEMESAIAEQENPIFAMERCVAKKMDAIESNAHCSGEFDGESAMNSVPVNETKKRKQRDTETYPTQELHPSRDSGEKMHKRMKHDDNVSTAQQSCDGGVARLSKSFHRPTTNDTKRDEGAKENVGANATEANNNETRRTPTKVYLKEFPFIFDGKGTWLCRHCLGVRCHSGSHHYFANHPPPNNFIDQHLRMCPVMSRHFPPHE